MNDGSDRDPYIPGHYLQRAPSGIIGVVSVLIALLMLGFAISEVRRISSVQPGLITAGAGIPVSGDAYVLRITEGEWQLNGQTLEPTDRLFRLSGAAARSNAIVVEYAPALPASSLETALDTVSRAGFTQVGMRTTTTAISKDTETAISNETGPDQQTTGTR